LKLNKHFFKEHLEQTIKIVEQKVTPLPHSVTVEFESKDEFMESVKSNPLIKHQIQLGLYQDIDNEYVGFAVVYERNKLPLRMLVGVPYVITICDEIAKKVLKPFNTNEVKAYLTHVYVHEITHLFEDHLKEHRKDIWEKSLNYTNGNEIMANELFADNIASLVTKDNELYKSVEKRIWSTVFRRIKQLRKQRGV
jgi:DNA-binding protein Fis